VSELFQFAYYGLSFWGMCGLDWSLMRSSLASNTFDIGVGVCVKGNFVDELGNRTEYVKIFCVRAVGGLS